MESRSGSGELLPSDSTVRSLGLMNQAARSFLPEPILDLAVGRERAVVRSREQCVCLTHE